MPRPVFHYAKFNNSPRLQSIANLLSDGKWHTTWNIIWESKTVCPAVGIAELRANGFTIRSKSEFLKKKRVWSYQLAVGLSSRKPHNGSMWI